MPVRASAGISLLLACLAVAGALALSLLLRADALRRDEAYAARYLAQAKLAGRARPVPLEKAPTPALSERICVTDLDTFAGAVARRFHSPWTDPAQGAALLRRISSLAVIGERFADAVLPPALPQRMGVAEKDGRRQRVAPEKRACDGAAYAEFICDPALVAICPKAGPAPR
jgi:hypothetical protein